MLKITIPKPCHEDWEAMTPNQQGRHCTACAKTVIDFTVLSDEEVQQFFIHQKEGKICGRFKQEQLHRIIISLPTNILQITMPRWKQFLTACLLAFSSMLFSCDAIIDNNVKGEPEFDMIKTTIGKPPAPGNVKVEFDTTITSISVTPTCNTTKGYTVMFERYTQGDTSTILDHRLNPAASESNIAIADTTIIFTGGVSIDTTPSLKKQGYWTIKNPPNADSTDCNNMKYY